MRNLSLRTQCTQRYFSVWRGRYLPHARCLRQCYVADICPLRRGPKPRRCACQEQGAVASSLPMVRMLQPWDGEAWVRGRCPSLSLLRLAASILKMHSATARSARRPFATRASSTPRKGMGSFCTGAKTSFSLGHVSAGFPFPPLEMLCLKAIEGLGVQVVHNLSVPSSCQDWLIKEWYPTHTRWTSCVWLWPIDQAARV